MSLASKGFDSNFSVQWTVKAILPTVDECDLEWARLIQTGFLVILRLAERSFCDLPAVTEKKTQQNKQLFN